MKRKSEVQLNVWIAEDAKASLAQWAKEPPYHSMGDVIEALVRAEGARRSGEVVEQEALPIIRNIVQTELRKANAQLRSDLREDMQLEFTGEIKTLLRAQSDRLAALIVRTFRHANITQRLAYALLSKSHGIEFARHAFEDASEKAGRDLATRSAKEEGESI